MALQAQAATFHIQEFWEFGKVRFVAGAARTHGRRAMDAMLGTGHVFVTGGAGICVSLAAQELRRCGAVRVVTSQTFTLGIGNMCERLGGGLLSVAKRAQFVAIAQGDE